MSTRIRDIKKGPTQKVKNTWTGWRYAVLIGGIVGLIGIALYPIAIEPMLNPEKYKKLQKQNRASELTS
jgi:hypothetical protein